MKCPYAVTRKLMQKTVYTYDDDGQQVIEQQTFETNLAEYVKCLEHECAAWQNGRCGYRGT